MGSFGESFGNNFRCLSLIAVVMVMLVLLERTDASGGGNANNGSNGFKVYDLPAIQWACEPFLDTKDNIKRNQNQHDLHSMEDKMRDACMQLRGGEIGEGTDNDAENSNSSIEESSVTLIEKEKKSDTETDATDSDNSSATTSISETAIENDESNIVGEDEQASSETDSKSKYTFSVFQENDGHETDPDGIPSRYMKMQNNQRDLAKAAVEKTVAWRKEHDIDTILARPHPNYDVSKAVFPHYFCGLDDTQHVILLQRPGLMNTNLAHKNSLSGEDLLFHYIYVMEYLWRIVDPASDATMTSIIDLTEMNMSILRKREQLRIGTLFLSTMDAHFPQRSHRTFLINAPKWFGALYRLASPLLRASTKEKIQILSKGKEQDEVLKHLLQDCPIPEGEKYEKVPAGIMEEELRKFCLARLEEGGVSMKPVEPM